jgi:class 3 adenylate cyclase/ketosteroid isomerase-like protein/tetratricopeptide (TPR) repeat protein
MPSLACRGCGHDNRDDARFCAGCGCRLQARCAACGAEVTPGERFCDRCGAPQTRTEALKVVTVVFADLTGSTALQESLDSESARTVMARFYDAMTAVVTAHGGCVEKFIGDAVVATFGADVVREDDALRGVRCAVAMTSALEALSAELEDDRGMRLGIRVGVNTGELAIGPDGILVGDTMNTAARLEQSAAAGEVLVGETTQRLVRRDVSLVALAPLELKGKAAPTRAWRVAGPGAEADTQGEAPLVGRSAELRRLGAAVDHVRAVRRCLLVTVIGSPGLGKSRLAAEFAAGLGLRATALAGRCEPSGEGLTFLPVAEVLRGAAGIAEGESPDSIRDRLAALLDDDDDRELVAESVAPILGAGGTSSAEETFWGVRRVLEALARKQPLVVVVDDIHWAEPLFLDLIEHLVQWVRDAPILLVALARPELRELRQALVAAGRRPFDVIELAPLGAGDCRAVIDGTLAGATQLPPALVDRILATTEGNPLFLGEVLRMLADDGRLVRAGGAWVAAGDLAEVEVPPTIQALLSARIARLPADERVVLESAAVIGKQFYRGAVETLVAPLVPRIDQQLEALRRKDMVEADGTYWIDEPVFRFHHVLLRDAAYRSLLKEARADLHERFAQWLQAKAGEIAGEHDEVIAYHLEQAHGYRRSLGRLDERGLALGARAAERLHLLGRRALARDDLAAAANLLGRALATDSGDATEILWDLTDALLSAGDAAAAREGVERFAVIAGGPRAEVLGAELAMLNGEEPLEAVLSRLTAAATALEQAGDTAAAARAHQVSAQTLARLGRVAAADEQLDRALMAARRVGDARRARAVLTAAPRAALWGPAPIVRASGRCLDVVRILRMTPGDRHVEAVALRCQAVLEAMRGRAASAREILASGRATLEELGLSLELHELGLHLGIVELLAGEPAEAERHLIAARDGLFDLGAGVGAAQAAALLARALIEQGRDDEAIEQSRLAEDHAGGDLKTTITWCGARAQVLARRGEHEEALALAQRAVDLAEPTDALADKADALLALARVLLAAGRAPTAAATAAAARELYAAKGHTVGVAQASELGGDGQPAQPGAPRSHARRTPSDPELAAFFATYAERYNGRDVEGVLALYRPDYVLHDHRPVGWDVVRGIAGAERQVRTAMNASPDLAFSIDEVLADQPGLLAARVLYRGTSTATGGAIEVAFAIVARIVDGKWAEVHMYPYGDDQGVRERFEQLSGAPAIPTAETAAFLADLTERFNAGDLDALMELHEPGYTLYDHRPMGWGEVRGIDATRLQFASVMGAAAHLVCDIEEVLAEGPGLVAARVVYRGTSGTTGGELEIPLGVVMRIVEGRAAESHIYGYEDGEGLLRCHSQLAASLHVEDRDLIAFVMRFSNLWARRDAAAIADAYPPDVVGIDHRRVGWGEVHGRKGIEDHIRSVLAISPDVRFSVDEILAARDGAIAMRVAWRGSSADSAGPFEAQHGWVARVKDGRMTAVDFFEPDDRERMMARFTQLAREPERS